MPESWYVICFTYMLHVVRTAHMIFEYPKNIHVIPLYFGFFCANNTVYHYHLPKGSLVFWVLRHISEKIIAWTFFLVRFYNHILRFSSDLQSFRPYPNFDIFCCIMHFCLVYESWSVIQFLETSQPVLFYNLLSK